MSQHYQNPAFYQAFMSSYHRTVSSNRLRDTRWELISINGQSWTYKKSKHFPKHTAQHAAVLSDESINRTQRSKFFSLCMHDFSFKYSVVQWSSFSLSIKETRNGPQWNSSFLSQYLSNRPSRQISQTLSSPNNVSLRKSNKTINSFSGWEFLCRKIRIKKCPTLANTIQVMTRKKLVQI